MGARLSIRGVLEITGRGPILAGDLLGGTIRPGMLLPEKASRDGATELQVVAVDYVDWALGQPASLGLQFKHPASAAQLAAAFPAGTEVELEDPLAPAFSGLACHGRLRRFWFPLSPGFGIGVTEISEARAEQLAVAVHLRHFPKSKLGAVVPDIDVSTLDSNHVQPNIGPSVVRGVWYPQLNL